MRPTPCTGSQPVCWRHTSWCDTSEITGIPTTRERCDRVASYCDTRTKQCRGTRIAYANPNPCVDWGSMASDPACLPAPRACALARSFTFYFNLLFYAALAWAGRPSRLTSVRVCHLKLTSRLTSVKSQQRTVY